MNVLVTLDVNMIRPLKVMLWSLFFNNPGERFHIYLMHSSIPDSAINDLQKYAGAAGQELTEIRVNPEFLSDAPVLPQYPKEMYYRLLACKFLPQTVDRILYLDPDILIINPIRELYDTELNGYLYAAAYHEAVPSTQINRLRLRAYEMSEYFNSGVLLLNIGLQRERVDAQEIFNYVSKHRNVMLLPDQDILNGLYATDIKALEELQFNFAVQYYHYYRLLSNGEITLDYILRNTAVLHFCGRHKPWKKHYNGPFAALYKHYEVLALYQKRPCDPLTAAHADE